MKKTNRALIGFAIAGVAAKYTISAVKRWRQSRDATADGWLRENHRGEVVSLDEGPALTAGLVVGTALSTKSLRNSASYTIAISGAGSFEWVDVLAVLCSDKGSRGHLGALEWGD